MLATLEFIETRDTPEVLFDKKNNQFKIAGNSLPEDSTKFYYPILDWIQEYVKDPNKSTHLICNMEYFNSSSAKMIYQIFIELEKIKDTGKDIKISWYYESEDKLIEEKGLEYQSILDIPFEMIKTK
ncbi:MAG: DUF1987 domain-containing protein [Bacteroidales bacterium]|jgi:hypothetical protein|nr:DUF1987 domain-containing protein [Bacteroidales bacterium]